MPTGGYAGGDLLGADGGCGANTGIGSGAAEALTASKQAAAVIIKAADANTGLIYVQTDGTDAAAATGYELGAGDSTPWLPVPGHDLANISVIASVNGEDVSFIYLR